MRYKIRQKMFSLGDKFTINDEYDYEKFIVRGKIFSLGSKLRIMDLNENELVYIEQEIFHLLPQFKIYMGERVVAQIKKEFTFFKPVFNIESTMGKFSLEGDFFAHDFQVLKDGKAAAVISKAWFTLSDTYGVDIDDNENQAFMLALVIVIDQVLHNNRNK